MTSISFLARCERPMAPRLIAKLATPAKSQANDAATDTKLKTETNKNKAKTTAVKTLVFCRRLIWVASELGTVFRSTIFGIRRSSSTNSLEVDQLGIKNTSHKIAIAISAMPLTPAGNSIP